MDPSEWLAIVTGILGLAGLIYTALRYNRDDAKTLVDEQSSVLRDMSLLNESLKKTVDDLRHERDGLASEVDRLSHELRNRTP